MMTEEQKKAVSYVKSELLKFQDLKNQLFMQRLIPNISPDRIIGIRTPDLKGFAKEFSRNPLALPYLEVLPHDTYEENAVHGMLIGILFKKDLNRSYDEVKRLLPYVDNWATCDTLAPKNFSTDINRLHENVLRWYTDEKPFIQRFAVVSSLEFLLEPDTFKADLIQTFSTMKSTEYYVNIAIAWYYSVALVKQYDSTIPLIESKKLDKWIHNKSIQKAVESFRISDEKKAYLKTLRIK